MSAQILDGKALALKMRGSLHEKVDAVKQAKGRPPRLAILTGPETPASKSYLDSKIKVCSQYGIEVALRRLGVQAQAEEALASLSSLNQDAAIDAIIIDLPLPDKVSPYLLYKALEQAKDAEGMSLEHYGRLFMARSYSEIENGTVRPPCTAEAIARLLIASSENALLNPGGTGLSKAFSEIKGKRAAVVGRSAIVGRPTAQLLSLLDLTVTTCHTKTINLKEEIGRADVVVACAGKARLIEGSWIKEGAIVIDAGINELNGKLMGDVDFDSAQKRAAWISPVPGGVGPVTTAVLLSRIVDLATQI
jgi:methylenetetrahydrofolate dehydrogenase (NADP+)/methenyltetrahydrofolate cyclohydrolase